MSKASYCRLLCQWAARGRHIRPAGQLRSPILNDKTAHFVRACSSVTTTESSVSWESIPVLQHVQGTNIKTVYRTDENNPCNHTVEHEGLYYKVRQDDYQKYIFHKQLPGYQKQVKTFNECALMVRQPALEMFDMIDNVNLNYPPLKLLLYGEYGNGKTMTLAHVIHRYAKQDWAIVHVPNVLLWLVHKMHRDAHRSTWNPKRVDLSEDSANWLRVFKNQNSAFLDLPTECLYTWTGTEKTEVGAPLGDLVEFGLSRIKFSSDCVGAVLKEMRIAASKKRVKLLVSIDGINGFWQNTRICIEQQKNIPAAMLSIVHNFKKMLEPTWTNGVIIGAICEKMSHVDERKQCTPRYLLGQEGFNALDPFVPVYVPGYSEKEIQNCIEYYIAMQWIQRPAGRTEQGKQELISLSNKNPGELMAISGRW